MQSVVPPCELLLCEPLIKPVDIDAEVIFELTQTLSILVLGDNETA